MNSRAYTEQLEHLETPFYFYDMELLGRTLEEVTHEASRYGYKVHYALKANFDKRIVETIRQAGLGADCVSGNEVRLAIETGYPASEVVFAGVGKSDREIRYALEQDIFSFNCESLQELEVINGIAASSGRVARIALRMNPDVDPKTHKHISTGMADNKFGIAATEVDEVIASLGSFANIRLVGLHFHIGSQVGDLGVFEQLCHRVNTIKAWFREQGVALEHINMGGGLGIDYDDPDAEPIPNFAAYFSICHRFLDQEEGQTVHFELGRSIVGQCGELITRVLYNKKTATGKDIVVLDAGMTDLIRPAMYGAHHVIENISAPGDATHTYTVVGPICESTDTFAAAVRLPRTQRGDLLSLRSAGAYGSAMSLRYNLRDLPGSVYSDRVSEGVRPLD